MTTSLSAPQVPILHAPADGPAYVVANSIGYSNALARLAQGEGPFAVDAERASGFRYDNRNYLVQVRRNGSGTFLFDPTALPALDELNHVMQSDEWIFHAASQDLGPLADQGLIPPAIFDTEYGARMLGIERVNLAAVTSHFLGLSLAKEHSHQDWSTRPLPESWLNYAALDVELLVDLAQAERTELAAQGKLEWAHQEFEHLRTLPPTSRQDPWRRTSGIQTIRDRKKLAVVRELWSEREKIAHAKDISPHRILPDRAIIAAATTIPSTVGSLLSMHDFGGNANRRRAHLWQRAISRALALSPSELPSMRLPSTPKAPPVKMWAEKSPLAAEKYEPAKELVDKLAAEYGMAVEHIVQPKVLRQLVWDSALAPIDVPVYLQENGARQWQIDLVGSNLNTILNN